MGSVWDMLSAEFLKTSQVQVSCRQCFYNPRAQELDLGIDSGVASRRK